MLDKGQRALTAKNCSSSKPFFDCSRLSAVGNSNASRYNSNNKFYFTALLAEMANKWPRCRYQLKCERVKF